MPYGVNSNGDEYAECPRCGKVANGKNEIHIKFGYRNMGNGNIIPQSHCKACRSEEANH